MKACEYLEWIDHDSRLTECPACGSSADKFTDLSKVDRYRMPARFVVCPTCAGVWITPRMGSTQYENFYTDGTYRKMVQAATGTKPDRVSIDSKQHAINILTVFNNAIGPEQRALDVGGGDGELAKILADNRVKTTIVDPFIDASVNGETRIIQKPAEQWIHDEQYDIAFCLATLDHLLDPLAVLREIRKATATLIVDVIDFPARWQIGQHEACKIDHPSNFNDVAITMLLGRVGWSVEKKHAFPADHQIAYLCRRSDPKDVPPQPAKVNQIIRGRLCSHSTSPSLSSLPY